MTEQISNPEKKIEQLLEAGQTDKAFELVYELAVTSARQKDFVASETYRDRLYEIDSFALSRIIEVNGIIETEKKNAILPDERKLWANLFERLEDKDADEFFLALKKEVFDSETLILGQGQPNDRLYFITQGQVKLFYSDKDKELLIAQLGRGNIFGDDTFFSVNVCTESVKTLTPVHLLVMDKAVFDQLKATRGTLEANLQKVCRAKRSVFQRLLQGNIDRRTFRRINWNTKILFHLLESSSPKAIQRSVTAELWDISKGGLSFYFQSKNREAVRNLIGQKIGVRFDLSVEGQTKTVGLTGVVHGVQSHILEEYSVHLRFDRRISDAVIRIIELNAEKAAGTHAGR